MESGCKYFSVFTLRRKIKSDKKLTNERRVKEFLGKLEDVNGRGPWRFQVLESQDAWGVGKKLDRKSINNYGEDHMRCRHKK